MVSQVQELSGRGSMGWTIANYAAATVARGSGGAVVALAVPPFLTRALPLDQYGAWVLVLQLAACVGYLDLVIQIAIGIFVAPETQRSDFKHRDSMINTALMALTASSAV